MTDLFRIRCLTPVHVGSGVELSRDIDYFARAGTTYVLDTERLIAAAVGMSGLIESLSRGERIGDFLVARRIDPRPLSLQTIPGDLEASRLRASIRTGDGRPMLPGSSIKGALRTLLLTAWVGKDRPHDGRSDRCVGAIRNAVSKKNAKTLDDSLFRSPTLRDPQGDVLRLLKCSDAIFAPEQVCIVSSKSVGTQRNTLTAVEALKAGASSVMRLTLDRSPLFQILGFPRPMPEWNDLAEWSRLHAAHLLEVDRKYFSGRAELSAPMQRCEELLQQVQAMDKNALLLRLAWGTGWRTMTGDILTDEERGNVLKRVGKTRKVVLDGHSARRSKPFDVFGWVCIEPVSPKEAKALFVPPVRIAATADVGETRDSHDRPVGARTVALEVDPFHNRLSGFKPNELGQLRALLQEIESRQDRNECLQLLGTRLHALYGNDKKQLKRLRDAYPDLAAFLVPPSQ